MSQHNGPARVSTGIRRQWQTNAMCIRCSTSTNILHSQSGQKRLTARMYMTDTWPWFLIIWKILLHVHHVARLHILRDHVLGISSQSDLRPIILAADTWSNRFVVRHLMIHRHDHDAINRDHNSETHDLKTWSWLIKIHKRHQTETWQDLKTRWPHTEQRRTILHSSSCNEEPKTAHAQLERVTSLRSQTVQTAVRQSPVFLP